MHDSYMLCGGQNEISEPLQASHTLCIGQNGLSETLHASYTLYGDQSRLCEPVQDSYGLVVVKTDFRNIYKPFIRLFAIQNVLSDLIQELYTICGGENGICESLHSARTRFAVI